MASNSAPPSPGKLAPKSQLVLSHAIATVAKTIDENILALSGSRDRLLPAIEHAVVHYEQAIEGIPGPINISAARYGADPALATIFPAPEDISTGLGRSIAVRNSISWFVENQHENVFAIMGTRRRPGEAALTDHTIRSLAASAQDARECLCEAAFTSLANAFTARLKERQREWRHIHARTASPARPATTSPVPTANPAPIQQDIFARHLDPAGAELSAEDSLNALIDWLHAPEAQMRIGHDDDAESGQGIRLPLMSSTDRRHWRVCMVEFPLQEALAAMAKTPAANRYILI